jgi:hypothetical protein
MNKKTAFVINLLEISVFLESNPPLLQFITLFWSSLQGRSSNETRKKDHPSGLFTQSVFFCLSGDGGGWLSDHRVMTFCYGSRDSFFVSVSWAEMFSALSDTSFY